MNVADLEHFRNLLFERERNLNELLDSDALVDADNIGKVRTLMEQIKDAFHRIENHSYGECKVCHGSIEKVKLELEPETEICLDCISEEEKALLEEELYVASKIYRALLPQEIGTIDGFDLAVKFISAGTVGGDYYDFLSPTKAGESRIVIADTVGKGLPAGLLISNLQGALRIFSEEIDSPSLLLTRLNQWFCRNLPTTKFVSMVCLHIGPQAGKSARVSYANAGHWPPILIRKNGDAERLDPTGGLLGVHKDFIYKEMSMQMDAGDLLVLFTDGITEARNIEGKMYEETGLIKFLQSNHFESCEALLNNLISNVIDFSGRPKFADDMTVIALHKTG